MFLNVAKWSLGFLFLTLILFTLQAISTFSFDHDHMEREVVVLAINDVYRIEGVEDGQRGGLSLVRALRKELEQQNPDLLFLHAGDFLFPSLISQWTQGAHMIEIMNALDGASGVQDSRMFVVFGNHEFDKSKQKHAALLPSTSRPVRISVARVQYTLCPERWEAVGCFGQFEDCTPCAEWGCSRGDFWSNY